MASLHFPTLPRLPHRSSIILTAPRTDLQYLQSMNAINCSTGDSLARGQAQAANKEEILSAVGGISTNLRLKLTGKAFSRGDHRAPQLLADSSLADRARRQGHSKDIEAIRAAAPHELDGLGERAQPFSFFPLLRRTFVARYNKPASSFFCALKITSPFTWEYLRFTGYGMLLSLRWPGGICHEQIVIGCCIFLIN